MTVPHYDLARHHFDVDIDVCVDVGQRAGLVGLGKDEIVWSGVFEVEHLLVLLVYSVKSYSFQIIYRLDSCTDIILSKNISTDKTFYGKANREHQEHTAEPAPNAVPAAGAEQIRDEKHGEYRANVFDIPDHHEE